MNRILLVEDNENLARMIKLNLELEGATVETVGDGESGLARACSLEADLVVLDLMLPKRSGYDVLKGMRSRGIETPVIVLTALGEETDRLHGFAAGADDYVTKPFSVLELGARIQAVLRRGQSRYGEAGVASARPVRVFGDLRVDEDARTVHRDGVPIELRPKEYELLVALIAREGRVATRKELLTDVWGYDAGVVSRTVDTHLGELRRKIEYDASRPKHIFTVRKIGFRFDG
ncbi:MAG: response regulator transcription factor [Gemmatimonadota bacterium]|nr:response regulator transcription factor [Gemmatimonadota bacterium]